MESLLENIRDGEHDGALDQIVEAVRERKKTLANWTMRSLKPGDEVRFSDQIRPKYLVGRTATVQKINRQSIVVSCPDDPTYGRFCGSQNVRCPNTLIEGLA